MRKNRKDITLPSGAVCTVRKISLFDIQAVGLSNVPAVFASGVRRPETELSDKEMDFAVKLTRVQLMRCCSPLINPDGTKVRIVDKAFHECTAEEVTIEELDQADAEMIIREVSGLSNMTKEAAEAAGPFREKPEPDGEPASNGETVWETAEPTA